MLLFCCKDNVFFVSLQNINPKTIKKMTKLLLFGLGMQEVLVIALIVLLLFGGKKIPELMKGLGKGVKSFKDGMKEIDEEVQVKDGETTNT